MEKFILFCSVVTFFSTVLTLFLMKKWLKYYLLDCLSPLMQKENGATNNELKKTIAAQAEIINELKKEVNEKNNQMSSLVEHINTFPIGLVSDSRN